MNGKNLTAGLLVSIVSVALAIGITYIVAFSGNGNGRNLTFNQLPTSTKAVPLLTGTIAPEEGNPTATPTSAFNCTFPMDIWLQFPDTWRISSYRLGDRVYSKEEMIDALRRNSDITHDRLLSQIFVVILNQQNGADATGIRGSFSQSVNWLVAFPTGSKPTEVDLQKAESLINALEKFNDGLGGPLPCRYNLSKATPVIMDTLGPEPSTTLTKEPVIFITWTPSVTPKPEQKKPKPAATKAAPQPTRTVPPVVTKVPTSAPPTRPPDPTQAPPDPTQPPADTPIPQVNTVAPPPQDTVAPTALYPAP